jgi:hydrogenase maturation protein HypF
MVPLVATAEPAGLARRARILVRGVVQGVGFRPFVYRLATEMRLRGWVRNSAGGAVLEVEGSEPELMRLARRIQAEHPLLASVQGLEVSILDPIGLGRFAIRDSEPGGPSRAPLLPDIATCDDCLDEIWNPGARRHRYPFTNCTRCGPRYSIAEALPWDRHNTSMRSFPMCEACRNEYEDPADRRFHAQPIACPACGPRLELWSPTGAVTARGEAALDGTLRALSEGRIAAVKGLGGFHLLVDAGDAAAVHRLRLRKRREEKPLAVMCRDLAAAERECYVSAPERRLLSSPEAPIVLLRRRADAGAVCGAVAPGNPRLGIVLPYTPLHHLLCAGFGRPLVATSGNLSEEPICTDERDALVRLAGVADVFLVHDRPIVRHVDDSIARICLGREQLLRRARGYAPLPVTVPSGARPVLALGAHQKSSIALGLDGQAFLSQHVGDLDGEAARGCFRRVIGGFEALYAPESPRLVADMHPDYASTRHAQSLSRHVARVQHHHAHVAACRADNELDGEVLGVAWDGSGYGPDGSVWGGEFLLSDGGSFRRVACLRRFRLPGGEAAVREPRRAALGALWAVLGREAFEQRDLAALRAFAPEEQRVLAGVLAAGFNSPWTSSAGRLFDAAASLLGLRQLAGFEGQAAMALEFAAEAAGEDGGPALRCDVRRFDPERDGSSGAGPATGSGFDPDWIVDWEPALRGLIAGRRRGRAASGLAWAFHEALARAIADVADRVGNDRVLLTGGCFQNLLLTEAAARQLRSAGLRPYWHQRVPPNDGGIALGQLAALRAGQES